MNYKYETEYKVYKILLKSDNNNILLKNYHKELIKQKGQLGNTIWNTFIKRFSTDFQKIYK